jgi:Na+-transporting methylmalonyl-CoA/oxaloacetate decarboxylase gamma subunit
MLLAITSDTWIITGLGFGIVLVLLFCLVYILQFFGWTMQKIEAPKAPKAPKAEQPSPESKPTKENIISAPSKPASASPADDTAAIAMALYLASLDAKHDAPTGMIATQARETAWNIKSIGLNNVGF